MRYRGLSSAPPSASGGIGTRHPHGCCAVTCGSRARVIDLPGAHGDHNYSRNRFQFGQADDLRRRLGQGHQEHDQRFSGRQLLDS